MNLLPYRELGFVNNIDRVLDRLVNEMAYRSAGETALTSWTPAADIREDSDRYLVVADIPGVNPKDIEITFEDGVLSISGERALEDRTEKEGYTRVERVFGKFSRQFRLPESADETAIKANGKNGVLEIEIPKKERSKPRRIEIS